MFQSVISRFAGACRTLATGLAATFCAAVATSCADGAADKEEEAVAAAAEAFASCYFNYDFAGARPYCTEGSLKWLSFAASNVTQTDLDVLKTQREGAECEANDIELTADTTAEAVLKVTNVMLTDTLGRPGRIVDEAVFTVKLVRRSGRWLVRMEGLPQSGKRNRG